MKCWDCLIVGAGPSGGGAAFTAARAGRSVLVLEKGDAVGLPVRCGEAVSRDAFTRNGLTPDPTWIAREVHEARMVTPNGKTIRFHEAGFCIRRDRFDRWLIDRAQQAGAELKVGCRVTHARKESRQWIVRAAGEHYRAAVLVMAGGAAGRVEGIADLRPPPVTIAAMQYKFRNRPEVRRDDLEFYHGEHFHPGYGWIFDRGSEVSIGMAGRRGLTQRLRSFCAAHGFDHQERISAHSGPIPLWYPCERFRHEELLWVGDAAGLVHPITCGGSIWPSRAGEWRERPSSKRCRAASRSA